MHALLNSIKSVSFLVAIILVGEPLHVLKSDLALVVPIEYSLVGCDVGGSGVELLVHGAVEIHEHLASSDGLQHSVFVIIVHFK